jgi:hypothetical protein
MEEPSPVVFHPPMPPLPAYPAAWGAANLADALPAPTASWEPDWFIGAGSHEPAIVQAENAAIRSLAANGALDAPHLEAWDGTAPPTRFYQRRSPAEMVALAGGHADAAEAYTMSKAVFAARCAAVDKVKSSY